MSDRGCFERNVDVSRETLEKLNIYAHLIKKWNRTINLVSASTISHIWSRHFLDSAQLYEMSSTTAATWVDLGSGGGFPGAVIAILAHDRATPLQVTCIESDLRKATFLQTVARETGVSIKVFSRRIEDVPAQNADVVSARALSSLSTLMSYAERHIAPKGQCFFLKGASVGEEILAAKQNWAFTFEEFTSKTDSAAKVLKIGEFSRV